MFNFPASDSTSPSLTLTSLGDLGSFKSRKTKVTSTPIGELGIPTFSPSQHIDAQKPRKQRLAAIFGASVGATMLVATVIIIVCFCLMRARRLARRTSQTGSSESSSHGNKNSSRHSMVFLELCILNHNDFEYFSKVYDNPFSDFYAASEC